MLTKTETQELFSKLSSLFTEERLQRIQAIAANRTRHVTLVLEDLYQEHNAAAILRSCDCFGVQDVHIIENRNSFKIKRSSVSQGAYKWLSLFRWTQHTKDSREAKGSQQTLRCLSALKKRGYRLAAATLRPGSIPFYEIPLEEPIAFLLGTEETGLTEEAQEQADYHVHIPMYGFTQSLNVSVAAAILLQNTIKRLWERNHTGWYLTEKEHLCLTLRWLIASCEGARYYIKALGHKKIECATQT